MFKFNKLILKKFKINKMILMKIIYNSSKISLKIYNSCNKFKYKHKQIYNNSWKTKVQIY